ncbi:unnamed protein product, partial [Sphacelaria rigidula]
EETPAPSSRCAYNAGQEERGVNAASVTVGASSSVPSVANPAIAVAIDPGNGSEPLADDYQLVGMRSTTTASQDTRETRPDASAERTTGLLMMHRQEENNENSAVDPEREEEEARGGEDQQQLQQCQ